MSKKTKISFFLVSLSQVFGYAEEELSALPSTPTQLNQKAPSQEPSDYSPLGISTNPSTVNITTGTGDLGRLLLKIPKESPFTIGGVLISDGDVVLSGGDSDISKWSGNNLLILDCAIDFEKLMKLKGGLLGVEFLQFNGMDSNASAGSVQGFDSMSVLPPFDRTELYQLWYRQSLFDEKLVVRIGKTVPTLDFNNVSRPVPVQHKSEAIPSVSGLLYTPIFVNPVNLGVIPGYYNSAYGVTVSIAPIDDYYITAGVYDGNLARGKQLGLTGPHFNGYYFSAVETGISWRAGKEHKPGIVALGGWYQTGKLSFLSNVGSVPSIVEQNGAQGAYLFGSQRVLFCNPGVNHSGLSVFWQLGYNHAKTLPMNRFVGGGFTAFAITRPLDSFGMGFACSWLNQKMFTRRTELMLQAYYQAHLFFNTYLEPVITYIPTPGGGNDLPQTWAATIQLINLF